MARMPRVRVWQGSLLGAMLLAGAVFLLPLVLAPQIPLVDPDEGLHAAIAQEMVERGDWIVPRYLGKPFLDKPVFYFWAQAASLRCFGMSEAAVRLPGLMFGLLGAATTALLAWRLLGRTAGMVAGLFYATSIFPAALAQVPMHDVALVPCVNLALWLGWETDRAASRRAALGTAALAGLTLGVAILTKGLVGVALVAAALGGYLLVARRLRPAICLYAAVALVVAALVAAAWYLAVEQRCPGYLRYFFLDRHVKGFVTGTQRHSDAPWWHYLPILLAGGMPWIAYVPSLLQDTWLGWHRPRGLAQFSARLAVPGQPAQGPKNVPVPLRPGDRHAGRGLLLPVAWLIGCTLLLSVSRSKLITYLLPVFPAVAILAAVPWARLLEGRLAPAARRSMGVTVWITCLCGTLGLPVLCFVVQRALPIRFSGLQWTVAVLAALSVAVPIVPWTLGHARATLAAGLAVVAVQLLVILAIVLPPAALEKSARDLAAHYNRQDYFPARFIMADERFGSLIFYLSPTLRADARAGRVVMVATEELTYYVPRHGGDFRAAGT